MAYAFVGEGQTESTTSSTSVSVTYTPTAGNLLVFFVSTGSVNQSVNSITDNLGVSNTYNALGSQLFDNVVNQQYAAFYAANCKGGSTTFTANWTSAASFNAIYVAEYSGIATLSPLIANTNVIAVASPGTSADAISTGAANATSQPALSWGACADASGGANVNAGTGYTGHAAQGTGSVWRMRGEDKRLIVTGNNSATFTAVTGTDEFTCVQGIFLEAAATDTLMGQAWM